MSEFQQRPLGDALVRMGLLTSGQLEAMMAVQRREGQPLSKQLVEAGFLTEDRLVQVLGEQLGVETVDLSEVWVHERVRELVLPSVARQFLVLPLARRRVGTHDALLLAMADPLDDEAVAVVSRRLPDEMRVVRLLSGEEDILRAVDMIYGLEHGTATPEVDDLQLPSLGKGTDSEHGELEPEATLEDTRPRKPSDKEQVPLDAFGDPPTAPAAAGVDTPDQFQVTEAAIPALRPAVQRARSSAISIEDEDRRTTLIPEDSQTMVAPPPGRSSEGEGIERDHPEPARSEARDQGPKSGGPRPGLPRAPATEIIRARGTRTPHIDDPDSRARNTRDVTRRVGPPGTPARTEMASEGRTRTPLATVGPVESAAEPARSDPSGAVPVSGRRAPVEGASARSDGSVAVSGHRSAVDGARSDPSGAVPVSGRRSAVDGARSDGAVPVSGRRPPTEGASARSDGSAPVSGRRSAIDGARFDGSGPVSGRRSPVSPALGASSPLATEVPREPVGDPDVLVKAVSPRVPPALLAVAAVSLIVIVAVGVWVVSKPPTVRANLPTSRIVEPALEATEPPDPPLAPIRRSRVIEIAPGVVDGPPPAGHRFVLVDGLELRATAAIDAEALLWLKGGQVVRLLDEVQSAQLVMVPPRGPAGFVDPDALGVQLPLAALARQFKFAGCVVPEGGIVDDCLYAARTQFEDCRLPCKADTRCAPACEAAFEICMTECRVSEQTARGRRRRRSR